MCLDLNISSFFKYRKVPTSRPVYYSILNSLGQRSQYIIIKFPLHNQSENPKMCYYSRQATPRDFTVCNFVTIPENVTHTPKKMQPA